MNQDPNMTGAPIPRSFDQLRTLTGTRNHCGKPLAGKRAEPGSPTRRGEMAGGMDLQPDHRKSTPDAQDPPTSRYETISRHRHLRIRLARLRRSGSQFRQGDRVVIHGRADIWVKQTRLSFIGDDIRKIGAGGLKEQIDELRKKAQGRRPVRRRPQKPLPNSPVHRRSAPRGRWKAM